MALRCLVVLLSASPLAAALGDTNSICSSVPEDELSLMQHRQEFRQGGKSQGEPKLSENQGDTKKLAGDESNGILPVMKELTKDAAQVNDLDDRLSRISTELAAFTHGSGKDKDALKHDDHPKDKDEEKHADKDKSTERHTEEVHKSEEPPSNAPHRTHGEEQLVKDDLHMWDDQRRAFKTWAEDVNRRWKHAEKVYAHGPVLPPVAPAMTQHFSDDDDDDDDDPMNHWLKSQLRWRRLDPRWKLAEQSLKDFNKYVDPEWLKESHKHMSKVFKDAYHVAEEAGQDFFQDMSNAADQIYKGRKQDAIEREKKKSDAAKKEEAGKTEAKEHGEGDKQKVQAGEEKGAEETQAHKDKETEKEAKEKEPKEHDAHAKKSD